MHTKEKVKQALIDIYESYKNKGLRSIYVYGSILTDDFNESTSDIDSIGIVEDSVPVELEDEIKDILKEKYPELQKFGFRFLYLSEVDGGAIKGTLAGFIHPSILLLGFPHWEYIAGTDFKRNQFKLEDISFKEAADLEIKNNIIGCNWREVSKIKQEKEMYFLKTLAWIIYFHERDRGLDFRFSYNNAYENAELNEKEIMRAILAVKEENWDTNVFKKNASLFQAFIDSLEYPSATTA